MKIAFSLLFLVACAEAEEARLDHAQIIAVRADPPSVAPGGRVKIDVLAGDTSGNVFETQPTSLEGLPVERTSEGWFVTAPMTPGPTPLVVSVTIDDELWPATKQIVVGEPAANPVVETMQIDGQSAAGELVLAKGTKPHLAAVSQGEMLGFAWFSSVGDLKFYRQPEAELDAAEAGEGLIVVVVRDTKGGVGWQIAPAKVE